MNNRMKKAEYLFDELGLIDDAIVAQAVGFRERVSRPTAWRRVVLIAAAIALVVSLMSTVVYVGFLRGTDKDEGTNADSYDDEENFMGIHITLDLALEAAESETAQKMSEKDVDLFDGRAKIIWQRGEDEDVYVMSLVSSYDTNRLTSALKEGYRISQPSNENENFKIWVSMGDGYVVSPELKNNSGNVYFGELFDYSSEISGSQELANLIYDMCS